MWKGGRDVTVVVCRDGFPGAPLKHRPSSIVKFICFLLNPSNLNSPHPFYVECRLASWYSARLFHVLAFEVDKFSTAARLNAFAPECPSTGIRGHGLSAVSRFSTRDTGAGIRREFIRHSIAWLVLAQPACDPPP